MQKLKQKVINSCWAYFKSLLVL